MSLKRIAAKLHDVRVRKEAEERTAHDLTGDRPLALPEARKLARWWQGNGWSATISPAGRFYSVKATRR